MLPVKYFNCITTNKSNEDQNLEFSTTFDNIILDKASKFSMAVIGFSIPNIGTPLFSYSANEFIITRQNTGVETPVQQLNYGFGPGVVMNYGQLVKAINQAFGLANTGSGFTQPFMTYDQATRLFKIKLDPSETSVWTFNKNLYTRFPTLPAAFNPLLPNRYAQLTFDTIPSTCVQETAALWSLSDYSRLIITAPGLPFSATSSAVSNSGNPLAIQTLASFENTDMEFNRSAFVYSESGQGNWTMHDLMMSSELRVVKLSVLAVNLFDDAIPIKLPPGKQAIIKLAFVEKPNDFPTK